MRFRVRVRLRVRLRLRVTVRVRLRLVRGDCIAVIAVRISAKESP